MFALQTISPIEPAVRAQAPAGPVYCFVPAGGTDGARTQSRNAIRQLSEAMRACLAAEGDGRAYLLADFLDETTSCIKCVDLNRSDPGQARDAITAAEAVFVVCAGDHASIEDACAQAAWVQHVLGSVHREEACGLLLLPVSGGLRAAEVEESLGLPVCGMLKTDDQFAQLARWIVQE